MESFSYTYDVLGNVLTRADANESLTETLTYDTLNRITSATVSAGVAPVKTFSYNAIGNLLTKSDVGTYSYPVAGSALPHAVTSVSGTITSTFSYDPNGNQTAGVGRSITYTSYNKPASITQGSSTLFFSHDVDHQRFMQQAPEGTTLYFDAFGVHAELFSSGTSSWYDYLGTGGALLGMRVLSGSTVTTRYFHTDNLGSISVITDTSGNVVERDGYDAWGKRRFPNGADDPTDSLTSQTTRGFTAQEELHDVGLVHLNGRVYDPLIARMTSADPMVPDPMNGQAWNRYSYVINNPLAFTDPSGYCFLGMCGFDNAVSNFFDNIFKQIGRVLRSTPILGNLAVAGAAALCAGPQAIVCAVAAAFLTTTAVSGLTSGNIGAGLKAGAIAAATAVAFWEVGNLTNAIAGVDPNQAHIQPQFGTPEYAFNVVAHAAVGCGAAAASGQQCGPSALAGGVTSAAGPIINAHGFVFGLVANIALGGGAAVLGGGKFENGAITGAFGYLFNQHGADPALPQPGDFIDVFNAWHAYWVDINVATLQSLGYTVTTEVGFWDISHTTYSRLDIVASLDGVPVFGMEVKTLPFDPGISSADVDKLYTPNQQIVYPDIRSGLAIPVGDNAANAGFTINAPLVYPFGILDVVVAGRGMH